MHLSGDLRKKKQKGDKIVVLTAYGAPDRAEAAARLGVDAFLHKPVSLVWLESLLRARIDDRRRGTEIQPMAAAG